MNVEAQVLLYTIVVFLALVAVLWRFAWGPLMRALDERERRIAARIKDAEDGRRAAAELLAGYERKLAAARQEAAEIIAESKRDASKVSEEILDSLEVQSARALERAKREIVMAKEAAVHDLRVQMAELTAELAARVIRREVRPDDHRRLIEEALAETEKSIR